MQDGGIILMIAALILLGEYDLMTAVFGWH